MAVVLSRREYVREAEEALDLIDYVIDLLEGCSDRDCIEDAVDLLRDAREIVERLEKAYTKIFGWWEECEAELEMCHEMLEEEE